VGRARRRSRTAGRATAAAAASATAPTAASRASPSAASRRAATGRTARARAVLAREARETLFFARDDPRRARSEPARGAEASDDDISRRRGALRDPWARAWVCATTAGGGLLRGSATDDPARERQRTPAKKAAKCQQHTGVMCARWTKGERLYAFDPRRVRFERSLDSATPPFQLGGETETRPSRWPARNRVGSERFRRGASSGFATRRVGSVGLDRIARGAFKALDRSRRAGRDRPRALGFPCGFRSPARTLPRALHPLSHPTRRYVLLPEHALRRRGGRLRQARRARRQGPRGPQGVRAHDQGSRQAQQQRFQVALRHQHLPGASRGATARPPERAREARAKRRSRPSAVAPAPRSSALERARGRPAPTERPRPTNERLFPPRRAVACFSLPFCRLYSWTRAGPARRDDISDRPTRAEIFWNHPSTAASADD